MAKPLNVPGAAFNSPKQPVREIVLPKLTSYQQEAYDWFGDAYQNGRVMCIKAPRQVGKSYLLQVELTVMAFNHPGCTSIIYEPTLSLSRNVFKSMFKAFETSGLLKTANAQLLEIEFVNGSTILFRSPDQTSRGLTVTGILILDEAAWLGGGGSNGDDSIFTILPFINAHNASLILASTPFTMDGYFYDMYLKGLNGDNENIKTFDWSKHPEISRFLTDEKKALYKQTMSRQKYTTEIDGDFLTDDGLLFQNIENCLNDTPEDTDVVYMGIDFGTGTANDDDSDYTVLAVFNNRGEMLKIYRTNNLSPMQQVEWLAALILDWANTHQVRSVLGEWNSIGSVYIDALNLKLKVRQITVSDWVTSNKSKQDLVTTFQIALENERVKLVADPNLLNELRRYQAEMTKSGAITYNGNKSHDDMVIASMLGYYAYFKGLGEFRFTMV